MYREIFEGFWDKKVLTIGFTEYIFFSVKFSEIYYVCEKVKVQRTLRYVNDPKIKINW